MSGGLPTLAAGVEEEDISHDLNENFFIKRTKLFVWKVQIQSL